MAQLLQQMHSPCWSWPASDGDLKIIAITQGPVAGKPTPTGWGNPENIDWNTLCTQSNVPDCLA